MPGDGRGVVCSAFRLFGRRLGKGGASSVGVCVPGAASRSGRRVEDCSCLTVS